jgi:hypothetical protein
MTPSPNIFISGPDTARRSADLLLAWSDAADDAEAAYQAWRHAERAEEAEAYVVYKAALDREEAAADALQLQTRLSRARELTVSCNAPGRP